MLHSKICGKCKLEKPLDEFHRRSDAVDGRQRMCKACNSDWVRGRYANNKESHYASVRRSRRARILYLRAMVRKIKEDRGCLDCGYRAHHCALDFDHRDRALKTMNVAFMLQKGLAEKTILSEIAKCDVRCANCHRIRTQKEIDVRWPSGKAPGC